MTKNLTVNRQNVLFLTAKGIPPPIETLMLQKLG